MLNQPPRSKVAVRTPLELYMRGHAEDSAEHMRAAFLTHRPAGERARRPADLVGSGLLLPAFQQHHRPRTNPPRRRSIDWLEASPAPRPWPRSRWCTASADLHRRLVLLKTEQGWKIANKAFPRTAPVSGSAPLLIAPLLQPCKAGFLRPPYLVFSNSSGAPRLRGSAHNASFLIAKSEPPRASKALKLRFSPSANSKA